MEGSNRILVYGHIGQRPELRYTGKGEAVCNFSVAENIEGAETPRWLKVVVWGKEAELCTAQLDKGLPVFVKGRNVDCEFKTKEGNLKKYTELRADRVGISIA